MSNIDLSDLPLFWRGRAKALRLLDSHRKESCGETLEAARIYEECADEFCAALEARNARCSTKK
jgi:hypothetical protein